MTDSKGQAEPRSLVTRIAQRLRTRSDSEHEMRFNALAFGTAILIYLLVAVGQDSTAIVIPPVYLAINLAVLGHILLHPGICRSRRIFSIASDLGALFCVLHMGGEATAILFPIYFWVILGNGFRFGIFFLLLSSAVGFVSFGAVVATTSFWSSYIALTAGLFGGMLLVPLCAMPLIHQLSEARRKAEVENREKGLLLASMSHELHPPLTAIVGTGSVLQDTKLDPAQREMARRVVSAGQRLLELINNIRDVSRPGSADAHRAQRDPCSADRSPYRNDSASHRTFRS
ncbi:histidine kinase dimerization/phospho-acceptor domain-containing protein [Inquilinus limosus]|uniref:histidine kinase dimerization/phospho-acceptor domain-containing protein n=1 Tax=Inquilinus limosus TaxID=171674 RepID=UPI000402B993|nr:histidine kinase dimerization/phospho-acceptor domain-containing protein [Inquilinus limosus]